MHKCETVAQQNQYCKEQTQTCESSKPFQNWHLWCALQRKIIKIKINTNNTNKIIIFIFKKNHPKSNSLLYDNTQPEERGQNRNKCSMHLACTVCALCTFLHTGEVKNANQTSGMLHAFARMPGGLVTCRRFRSLMLCLLLFL